MISVGQTYCDENGNYLIVSRVSGNTVRLLGTRTYRITIGKFLRDISCGAFKKVG